MTGSTRLLLLGRGCSRPAPAISSTWSFLTTATPSPPGRLRWSLTLPTICNSRCPSRFTSRTLTGSRSSSCRTGWEGVNLSQELNIELEPDDFTSAYYEGWVNVAMSRWSKSGSAAQKAVRPAPPVFVNGDRQALVDNALVADSASRNGHFLTFLYTNDYDLSPAQGRAPRLLQPLRAEPGQLRAPSSTRSMAGETWLPVLYMIARDDIVKDDDGNVDAIATLENGRTATLPLAITRTRSRRSAAIMARTSARRFPRNLPLTSAAGSTTTRPSRSGTSCSGCPRRTAKKRFASAWPRAAPIAGTGASIISASTASCQARCRRSSRPARPPEATEPTRCR